MAPSRPSVKLQELFGLAETPRIGPRREPVLLALLAPNGRSGPDDARSAQLLGAHVPGGPKGIARPLPEAPVARGSVDRTADRASETAALTVVNRRADRRTAAGRRAPRARSSASTYSIVRKRRPSARYTSPIPPRPSSATRRDRPATIDPGAKRPPIADGGRTEGVPGAAVRVTQGPIVRSSSEGVATLESLLEEQYENDSDCGRGARRRRAAARAGRKAGEPGRSGGDAGRWKIREGRGRAGVPRRQVD